MYFRRCLISAFLLTSCATFAADVKIAEDRMLVVDGKRLFVIGIYENPADDAMLKQVAQAGFNLVHASANTAALDRLHANGLYGWVNVGAWIDFSANREDHESQLQQTAATCGDHPALLVWEAPDEPLWSCWLSGWNGAETFDDQLRLFRENVNRVCPGLAAGHEFLRQLDARHPVWMNHATGNSIEDLAAFARGADIVGCDIYPLMPYPTPIIDISRRDLGMVGWQTQRMQVSAPGKPVWMVLQGFGWLDIDGLFGKKSPDCQRPTCAETRFMAFDAIVRGARAILHWGTAYIGKDLPLWHDLLKVTREIADLQPVLSAPDTAIKADMTSAVFLNLLPGGVYALGKDVAGQTWWFIVNEMWFPKEYQLSGLDKLEGAVYEDAAANVTTTVKNGRIDLSIPGYGVHILRPRP